MAGRRRHPLGCPGFQHPGGGPALAQPNQLVIDLGTCHTVAVVQREGQAPRPLLFDGSPLLPSGVYRDPGGTLAVGRDAERLSHLDPSRFEPYPKRCVDDGAVLLGDAPTPVVELLAALLRRVVGEASPDGTPRLVTLTCPADWGPQRRDILRTAARAAGLRDVRLVDEPVAAATYCAEVLGQPVPVGRSLLVFDFGGGTLDVTVVRRDPDGMRVLAVGGLDDLGGVDVDAALVGHLGQLVALRHPEVWRRLVDPHGTGEQRHRRTFWTEVRAAKEMLSRAPSAPVQIPGTDDALHLTREQLELPVAFGGLLVGGSRPTSPAAGPTGPVSAAPYASAPVTGPTPPAYPIPPGNPPAPAPSTDAVTYDRTVKYAYRRSYVIIAVMLLVVGLAYGGTRLFTTGGHLFDSITGGGGRADNAQPGTGGPLALVGSEIDLGGDGAHAVAAGAGLVFYSVTGGGKTTVHALDPASGKDKWTATAAVEPAEESLTVVGDLVVLDARESATDAGKDMRVVLQAADGRVLQKMDWSTRKDVLYFGTDVVTSSDRPFQTQRINLRTGQVAWTHPAPKGVIIADHRVNPELTWASDGKSVPAPVKRSTESFGVSANRVVELNTEVGTAAVLDAAGKQTATGQVPVEDKLWTAFDGLLVGALTDDASPGRAQLGAYRLDNLKQAWPPVPLSPGDEIEYVHPCNERLVCVTYQKKSDDTKAIMVVDTRTGQKVTWSRQPAYGEFSEDPYWLVQGGLMVYGEGSFPPTLMCRRTGIEVLNPTTGETLHTLAEGKQACGDSVVGSAGKYVVMSSIHVDVNTSRTTIQVSLVDVTTGKQSDRLDAGPGDKQLDGVAVLGTTLSVIGGDHKLRVATAAKLT